MSIAKADELRRASRPRRTSADASRATRARAVVQSRSLLGLAVLVVAALAAIVSIRCPTSPAGLDAKGLYRENVAGDLFRAYEQLRRGIVEQRVTVADVDRFAAFIDDEERLATVRTALEAAPLDRNAARSLYAVLLTTPPDADLLYEYLASAMPERADAARDSSRRGIRYAWGWSYLARAGLEAYTITGQQRFLALVAASGDGVVADRDHLHGRIDTHRGRTMKSWGHCADEHEAEYTCIVTHAGRIAYPLLLYAEIVEAHAELQAEHRDRARRFRLAAADALAEFDADFRLGPGSTGGYYFRGQRGDVEPLNHASAVGEAYAVLAALTGSASDRRRVEDLAAWYRSSIEIAENGTWTWPYAPAPETIGRPGVHGEAIWKAQITIALPLAAEARGIAFTAEDMREITRTFLVNVDRDGAINHTIDTEFRPIAGKDGSYCLLAGWIHLDVHAPEIRPVIEQTVARRLDLFPGGWFTKPVTVFAYAHRLGATDTTPRQAEAE